MSRISHAAVTARALFNTLQFLMCAWLLFELAAVFVWFLCEPLPRVLMATFLVFAVILRAGMLLFCLQMEDSMRRVEGTKYRQQKQKQKLTPPPPPQQQQPTDEQQQLLTVTTTVN